MSARTYTLEIDDATAAEIASTLSAVHMFEVADAIRAQIPEPRMDEPGWGAMVFAHTNDSPDRRKFLHSYFAGAPGRESKWIEEDGLRWWFWSELIDPAPAGDES